MMKLLTLEYLKFKRFHALKFIILAYMICVPAWMFFINFFFRIEPELAKLISQDDPLAFPNIWEYITYSASFFNVLLAVIIVTITTNDFQYKTMRQNIIDGLSKGEVIYGKFILVIALSLVATLYTLLSGMTIGFINGTSSNWYQNIHFISLYGIQTLGYFSFAFLFAIVVKRPAIAIITFIVYFPVETIIGKIISSDLYQFFPLKVYADLTPIPFFKSLLAMAAKKTGEHAFVLDDQLRIILSLIYVSLFFLGTYLLLKRKDL